MSSMQKQGLLQKARAAEQGGEDWESGDLGYITMVHWREHIEIVSGVNWMVPAAENRSDEIFFHKSKSLSSVCLSKVAVVLFLVKTELEGELL